MRSGGGSAYSWTLFSEEYMRVITFGKWRTHESRSKVSIKHFQLRRDGRVPSWILVGYNMCLHKRLDWVALSSSVLKEVSELQLTANQFILPVQKSPINCSRPGTLLRLGINSRRPSLWLWQERGGVINATNGQWSGSKPNLTGHFIGRIDRNMNKQRMEAWEIFDKEQHTNPFYKVLTITPDKGVSRSVTTTSTSLCVTPCLCGIEPICCPFLTCRL